MPCSEAAGPELGKGHSPHFAPEEMGRPMRPKHILLFEILKSFISIAIAHRQRNFREFDRLRTLI